MKIMLTKTYHNESRDRLKKRAALPSELKEGFKALDMAIFDGAIPLRYRELIALAVSLTTQCPHCIEAQSAVARNAGVTEAEMFQIAICTSAIQSEMTLKHMMHAAHIPERRF